MIHIFQIVNTLEKTIIKDDPTKFLSNYNFRKKKKTVIKDGLHNNSHFLKAFVNTILGRCEFLLFFISLPMI